MCDYDNNLQAKTKQADMAAGTTSWPQVAQVPAIECLRKEFRSNDNRQADIARAIRILEQHPEFEQFKWLLDKGLI